MGEVVFVALGSNLGNRAAYLDQGRAGLNDISRTRIVAETTVEETEPFGPPGQDPYLNQMVAIDTELSPLELLDALHTIERSAGRTRRIRWGARTLDLDIVRFGDRTISNADLTVPHPGLRDRGFWQREVLELERVLNG